MEELLMPGLDTLIREIDEKAKKLKGTIKTGRTHLMDAMPIDFAQELSGWSAQLKSCKSSILSANTEFGYDFIILLFKTFGLDIVLTQKF